VQPDVVVLLEVTVVVPEVIVVVLVTIMVDVEVELSWLPQAP